LGFLDKESPKKIFRETDDIYDMNNFENQVIMDLEKYFSEAHIKDCFISIDGTVDTVVF
jgi:hypothetical protein